MTLLSGSNFTRKAIAQLLFVSMALLCFSPAQAYLNRTYSTLEAAVEFNGDFVENWATNLIYGINLKWIE